MCVQCAAPGGGSCLSPLFDLFASAKKGCCDTPCGQLINGMFLPLKFATGGVIPTPCPGVADPTGLDLGDSDEGTPSAEETAEKIKMDEAGAEKRRAAVRYLGTVPCHYYPKAEAALITSLRADHNECVRWEAAHVLSQGCCCTKKTIQALTIVASGSDKDGNPAEISPRVQAQACNALQVCLAMIPQKVRDAKPTKRPEVPAPKAVSPPSPQRPELPANDQARLGEPDHGVRLASYYEAVDSTPMSQVLAEARRALASARAILQAPSEARPRGNLYDLWVRSKAPAAAPLPASRPLSPPLSPPLSRLLSPPVSPLLSPGVRTPL